MTTFRGAIRDFQLANPLYSAARVSFYTVDEDGESTSTLATLYAAPTGSQTVANPQTLDSEGKFIAPVYLAGPVIAEVVSATVGSHTTGIIGARGTWRGDWATATVYYATDFIVDPVSGNIYGALDDYVSGVSVSADVTAGHLDLIIDQAAIISGGAALAIKVPCKRATTGNITLSGLQSIDGDTTVAGERVLVKDQTDATENGIYNAASGAWTRSVDCDASAKFGNGMIVYVTDGTVNHNRAWQVSIPSPFTLGTDAVTWEAADLPNSAIEIRIGSAPDGGITTGVKGSRIVPFDCDIQAARLFANKSGSIVVDIYRAQFPTVPTSAEKITASAPPTLSSQQASQDTTLTGWATALNKDDLLVFDVTSVGELQFVTLVLPVTRK